MADNVLGCLSLDSREPGIICEGGNQDLGPKVVKACLS